MLQDIDRRLGAGGVEAHRSHPDVRVPLAAPEAPKRTRAPVMLLGLAVGVVAGLAWLQTREGEKPAPAPMRVAAPTPPKVETPAPPAPAPAPETAPQPAPVAAAVSEAPSAPEAGKPRQERPARPRSPVDTFKLSLNLSRAIAEPEPVRPAAAAAAAPAAPAVTKSEVPRRRVAHEETLSAARALWEQGARANALATVREALAAAESSRNIAAIPVLARELARLEVADNRPQPALDLLRKMEAAFANDADAWALRGNAAQRVSQHGEAVLAYLTALRLRPSEGNWMLGAAISLAAEGRLEEAQSWVDRAGERGAITPTIASYLQQLGLAARR